MTGGRRREGPDLQRLSSIFRALGQPNRLDLLAQLQTPRELRDIRLHPARREQKRSAQRPLSPQVVEYHLQQLRALGLVRVRTIERGGRSLRVFALSHARLFLLQEELRRLSLVAPSGAGSTSRLGATGRARVAPLPGGTPSFTLVNGPYEGTRFELPPPGPWTVGRSARSAVAIPYDPFVSRTTATLREDGEGFRLERSAAVRNPLFVNWSEVAPGSSVPLASGDVLGVGRSLLVFRGA